MSHDELRRPREFFIHRKEFFIHRELFIHRHSSDSDVDTRKLLPKKKAVRGPHLRHHPVRHTRRGTILSSTCIQYFLLFLLHHRLGFPHPFVHLLFEPQFDEVNGVFGDTLTISPIHHSTPYSHPVLPPVSPSPPSPLYPLPRPFVV